MLEQVFQRVPELSPFIRFLHGDGAVGAAMVQAGPDYIFLTGSTATGKKVMQAAAERLIPVACELGGKDAMIVLEDADLESAAKWGVWGAFYNTGQACMSVERVYVVEAAYEEFVRLAVEHTQRLKVGYTIDQKSPYYMGPMTDPRQVKIIERHLQDAQEKGARILTGGGKNEMFFEPAVLVDVDHSMLLMQEETFGPFMPIVKVRDEEEAIRLANDCSLGLGASVWSGDLERAHRVAHRIEASSVVINDTIAQFAIPLLPFGGIKQSGYGRTHGKEGLMQFTRPYAYLYGQPPASWDLTVVARKPGNYRLMAGLTRLMFGVGAQRLQPVAELLEEAAKPLQPKSPVLGLSAALAAGAALSGIVLASKRRRAKQ
jgi:acyl-CoA reductase-like NAD-dependent aldehyde dehydrogenase